MRKHPSSGTPPPLGSKVRGKVDAVPGFGKLVDCEPGRGVYHIPVARIEPDPGQPRKEFDPDELERLSESLRAHGQIQPIEVRWEESAGRYRIIAGERRWRAAPRAGLMHLLCVVSIDPLPPDERLARQLAENCCRADLPPLELAAALKGLADLGWSNRRLAEETGLSLGSVSQALSLLKLPVPVRDLIESGDLAPSTASQVVQLPDPADQVELATRAVEEGLTRDQVRDAARELREKEHAGGASTRAPRGDPARSTVERAAPPAEPTEPLPLADRVLMELLCPNRYAEISWETLAERGATDDLVEREVTRHLGTGQVVAGTLDGLGYSYRGGMHPALWIGWHRGKDPGPQPPPTLGRHELVARARSLFEIGPPGGNSDPDAPPARSTVERAALPPPTPVEAVLVPEPETGPPVVMKRSAPLGLPMGYEFRPRAGVYVAILWQPGADVLGRSDPGSVLREAAAMADAFDPDAPGALEVVEGDDDPEGQGGADG